MASAPVIPEVTIGGAVLSLSHGAGTSRWSNKMISGGKTSEERKNLQAGFAGAGRAPFSPVNLSLLSVSFSISPSCLKCWTGFDNFALAPLCPVKLILLSVDVVCVMVRGMGGS